MTTSLTSRPAPAARLSEELTHGVDLSWVPTGTFIDGTWGPARDGAMASVIDPATEETLAEVADAGAPDAAMAAQAAASAQHTWSRTAAGERAQILGDVRDLMLERADALATVMSLEMGKTVVEARGEVTYAAEFFGWFAGEAVRIDGGYAQRPDGGARTLQIKQPVGPCLLITPWNFPLAMGARKIGPAIAAGCTSILKPAPQTPLTSLALAQILQDVGLPHGVVNVLPGTRAAEVTTVLLDSGVIRKLSFTGSTAVGRVLLGQCADRVVRTSMELGGNAPFIVLADADVELAVDAAFAAKMRNMGEACTAANRMLVHSSLAEEFTARLGARMKALTLGPGTDPSTDVGPMIDAAARDKISGLVQDAVDRGARLVARVDEVPETGFFVAPTVLADVPPDAELNHAEIFGPVAAISTFDSVDEAVERANDTDWGLVAYLITAGLDRALDVSERLEVGMVGLNTGVVSTPSAPFGGIKQSGLGREGGRQGIEEYLEIKYVSTPRTR